MKNLLLILAVFLIPVATFAGEKATPTGKKPATASTKKTKEKCVVPKLGKLKTYPPEDAVPSKNPISENLSDTCYCKAIVERYINFNTTRPTTDLTDMLNLHKNNRKGFECINKFHGEKVSMNPCFDLEHIKDKPEIKKLWEQYCVP